MTAFLADLDAPPLWMQRRWIALALGLLLAGVALTAIAMMR